MFRSLKNIQIEILYTNYCRVDFKLIRFENVLIFKMGVYKINFSL